MTAEHRNNGNGKADPTRLELASEFASVAVEVDFVANGPRLRIENRQNGRVVYLDPLELASLTWLTHDQLGPFLDPGRTGWASRPPKEPETT